MSELLFRPLPLGRYPTPVERVDALSTPDTELWVKRDDRTHDVCGGNKVRKLEWLLAEARTRGATRILTVGAAGSHHVLTTTYFAKLEGLDVDAVLVPQLRTHHVVEVLGAAIALGLHAIPVRSRSAAALALVLRRATAAMAKKRTRFVPLGGSSVIGSMGYVAAARELATQVRSGAMPEPDLCVVALGSGGTAAGLAAGFAAERMKTHVVGICISKPAWALRLHARLLARACARHTPERPRRVRLTVDQRFLGRGYGFPTQAGDDATPIALGAKLVLDPTYTAKAFAGALWHVAHPPSRRGCVILYWHTLGAFEALAPLGKLSQGSFASARAEEFARVGHLLLTTKVR